MLKWLRGLWKWFGTGEAPGSVERETGPRVEEHAHKPAPAISSGTAPRQAERTRRARRIDVWVGLDFGTSATKILYRTYNSGDQKTFTLVPSPGPVVRGSVVPSLAALTPDGTLHLGSAADEWLASRPIDDGMRRFKMLVAGCVDERYLDRECLEGFRRHVASTLGSPEAVSPEAVAATYLARVMREVTRLIKASVQADEVKVMFNTCVPIDQVENRAVEMAFQRMAATADHLAQCTSWEGETAEDLLVAERTLKTASYSVESASTRLLVVPEAVASFATYMHSLQAREGLHALIDIGAGTTDVSIAYLSKHKAAPKSVSWFAAGSVPVAGGRVEDALAEEWRKQGRLSFSHSDLLCALRGEEVESRQLARNLSRRVLSEISTLTRSVWGSAYGKFPGQPNWKGKVTIFLSGGGARLPCAVEVLRETWYPAWGPWKVELLPAAADLPSGTELGFERLSVAYGLCTDYAKLNMNHVLPNWVPAGQLPPTQWHPDLVGQTDEPGGPT